MGKDTNSIYISNPEVFSVDFNSDHLSNVPISNTETDASIYSASPTSIDDSIDQSLYGGKNSKTFDDQKIKKNTTIITTIAATLVASAVGVVGIINPLINRPRVSNGEYKLVGNALNYKFNFTSTSNYHSTLLLYLGEEKVSELPIANEKVIEGSFTLTDHGNYHLDIYSTNTIDYSKQMVLYTFTY